MMADELVKRETVLRVQNRFNRMPMEKLGAMLLHAGRLSLSRDDTKAALGRGLHAQILWAMRPEYDSEREGR